MKNEKYWRYLKYCLLVLCYGISIIIYYSPSSIPPELFMSIQLKEIFNQLTRMAMISIAFHIVVAVLAIGAMCAIDLIINEISNHKIISIDTKDYHLVNLNNLENNIDVLNPFLYGSKTRCLLE